MKKASKRITSSKTTKRSGDNRISKMPAATSVRSNQKAAKKRVTTKVEHKVKPYPVAEPQKSVSQNYQDQERQARYFKALVENSHEAILLISPKGELLYQSPALLEMGGYSNSELLGKNAMEFFHQDYLADFQELMVELARRPGLSARRQYQLLHKGGYYIWVEGTMTNRTDDTDIRAFIVNFHDITQHKQEEFELLKLHKAVDSSAEIVFYTNPDGVFTFVNAAFTRAYGYTAEEVVGKSTPRILKSGSLDDGFYHQFWKSLITGAEVRVDIRNRTKDGRLIDIEAIANAIADRDNKISGFVGLQRDITDRKRAAELLRQNEEKFRLITENITDGVLILAADTQVKYVSASYLRQLGYSEQEQLSKNPNDIYELIHPEDRAELFGRIFEAIESKVESLDYTYRAKHKSGKYIWREDRAKFNYDDQGNHLDTYVICRDISQRKQAEAALKESEARFRILADKAPVFIWLVNEEALCYYMNKPWLEFTGRTIEQELGNGWAEGIHPEDVEVCLTRFGDAFATRKEFKLEYRSLRADGQYRWLLDHGTPRFDPDGKFLGFIGSCVDITESKESAEKVRLSEEQYRLLFENMQEGFALFEPVFDSQGSIVNAKILDANESFEKHTGLKSSDVVGKLLHEVLPQMDARQLELFGQVAITGIPRTVEYFSEAFKRFMRIKAFSPRRGQFATMLEDISEGKRIELRLEENELRYRLLFNFANEGILIMTLEGKIFEVNRAFARMHGYTVEELRKMDISNLDVRGKVALSSREDIVNRTLKGEVVQMEAEHVHKDGHSFPISITTSIINLNGKKYFQASHVDITERRREEATLLKLHKAINSSGEIMFLTDKHGTFTFVNHAFTAKYGYIPEEVVGKVTPRILKSGSVAQGAYKKFWNEILVGMEVRSEYVNRCKDGTLLDVEGSVSPIYDKEHTIAGFVGVQRDIRERKKAEAELRNYQENLEEMVRTRTKELHAALHKERELGELKSKFVSIASHEFRTPLSTISLAAESVRRYADKLSKEEISRKLLKIEDQVSHMTNLLDDILTIGRSDAGKTTVHSTELNLKEFVMVLMDEVKSSAKEARDIQLNFASEATVIRIDDKLLRNTLNNLLTNALKFSPQNSPVRLSVADESGGIRLDVEDHGIGIAEAELATVFEAFNRGSNATHVQGTGLGLSIVKRAVTLMGGEISVKSVINLGTTFSVWLPLDAG